MHASSSCPLTPNPLRAWCLARVPQFKSFTRQVEEAQVDVFRSLAPAQQQPSAGCSSFFQQALLHWRVSPRPRPPLVSPPLRHVFSPHTLAFLAPISHSPLPMPPRAPPFPPMPPHSLPCPPIPSHAPPFPPMPPHSLPCPPIPSHAPPFPPMPHMTPHAHHNETPHELPYPPTNPHALPYLLMLPPVAHLPSCPPCPRAPPYFSPPHPPQELSAAVDFNEVHSEVAPLVASLAQLVFHRHRIVHALRARLSMRALLSLPPLLSLLGTLARDLQHDFLPGKCSSLMTPLSARLAISNPCLRLFCFPITPAARSPACSFLPLCLDACLRLLQQGADRDAAVLQQVVECVAQMVKHLRHYLTPDIVTLLKMTKALRFYPADYVRELVAHSLAFVLRTAPPKQMARGVRWVLAEARAVACEERESGVALLLANAAKGPAHSLHSKAAPLLLRLLLLPSSLRPPALLLLQGQRAAGAADVALTVVTRVIRLLAAHLTPATAGPLLSLLLTTASQAVQGGRDGGKGGAGGEDEGKGEEQGDGEEGEEGGEGKEGGVSGGGGRWEEARRIADVVHLLNAALQHRRGMLVTHLSPFVSLSLSLASHPLLLASLRSSSSPSPPLPAPPRCSQQQQENGEGETGEGVGGAAGTAGDAGEGEDAGREGDKVQHEVVREVMLLLLGHAVVPAPAGTAATPRAAPPAAPHHAVTTLYLTPHPLMRDSHIPVLMLFARAVTSPHPSAIDAFRTLLHGRDEAIAHATTPRLAPHCAPPHLAQPLPWPHVITDVSRQLGTSLESQSEKGGEGQEEADGEQAGKGRVRKRRKRQQGEEGSEGSLGRAVAAVPRPPVAAFMDSHQSRQQQQEARGAWEGVLAAALETHSVLLSSHSAANLPCHLPLYLSAARHHCRSLPILSAVALFLQAFPRAQVGDTSASLPAFPPDLSANHMPAMLEALQDNFCHPAREMRVASLRIICHFAPLLVRVGGEGGEARGRSKGKRRAEQAAGGAVVVAGEDAEPCLVFHQVEELESAPYDLQMGRHAATALAALAAHATSARLPNQLLPAVSRCVLGLLHSKFAMMWQPAIGCLAALLSAHPSSTWLVVWRELRHLQGSFLLAAAGAPAESGGGAQGEGQGEEGGDGGGEEGGEHEDGEDGSGSGAALSLSLLHSAMSRSNSVLPPASSCTSHCTTSAPLHLCLHRFFPFPPLPPPTPFPLLSPPGITDLFLRTAMAVPSGAPPSAVLSSLLRALRQAPAVAATRLSPAPPPPPSVGTALTPRACTCAANLASGQQRRGTAGQQLAALFLAFVGDSDDCLPTAHTGHVEMIQGGAERAGGEEGEEAEEGVVVNRAMVRGKQWHVVLSDWLELLKRVELTACGPKGEPLKHVIIDRFLVHPDPAVQQLALDCLVAWRHGCLPKYAARLAALASYRSLKETLTTWDISPVDGDGEEGEEEEEGRVAEADRASVIPVIIRLLLPKLKKRSGQPAGKVRRVILRSAQVAVMSAHASLLLGILAASTVRSAPFFTRRIPLSPHSPLSQAAAVVQRGTVLTFLARLPPSELLPLFHLMLLPFRPALRPAHQPGAVVQGEAGEEAWQQALRQGATEDFLLLLGEGGDEGEGEAAGEEGKEGAAGAGAGAGAGVGVGMVGRKRVSGFLHLAVDVVRVMSRHQLQPYVLALLAVAVRTVQCYPPLPPSAAGGEGRVEERLDEKMGEAVEEKEIIEEEGEGKEEVEVEEEEEAEEAEELEGEEGQKDEVMKGKEEGADAAAEGPGDADEDGHKEAGVDAPEEDSEDDDDDTEANTNASQSISPHVPSWTRELRSLALRLLAAILAKFPDIATRPSLPAPLRPWPLLLAALSPALTHLAVDNAASSEPSALLALLLALSRSPRLALLLASHPHALPALSALLSSPSARLPVVGAAMGVLSHVVAWGVVEREEGEEGEEEGEVVLQWEQAGGQMGGEVEGVRVAIGKAVEGHLAAILPHMQQFIARQGALYSKGAGRALKVSALAVVGRMAGMVTHAHLAGQLAAALTPFLRQAAGGRRRVDESTTAAVLAVLQSLAPLLSRTAAATCVRLFAPLVTHLQSRPARLALVHTLSALAAAHPSHSMRLLASLVADLCAYDPARIDEYDYTRRLHAYTSMHCHLPDPPATSTPSSKDGSDTAATELQRSAEQVQQQVVVAVGREGCLLLLSCAVRDMADEDMSLRHSAAHFLQSFVRLAAALAALPPAPGATAGARKGGEGEEGGAVSGREARELVNAVLLRHIKKGLHSPIVVVRRVCPLPSRSAPQPLLGPALERSSFPPVAVPAASSHLTHSSHLAAALELARKPSFYLPHSLSPYTWVLLLRDVALHMGATSPVAELRCLVREDDVEADFFHNLVHLQTHRRVRALTKFAALCPTAHFSPVRPCTSGVPTSHRYAHSHIAGVLIHTNCGLNARLCLARISHSNAFFFTVAHTTYPLHSSILRRTNTPLPPARSELSLSPPLLSRTALHVSLSPSPPPHQEVLLEAVVPALLRQLVEGRPDSESGVMDATMAALSALAARLPWPAFHSLLSRLLALLPRRKEKGEQWWEESKGRGGGRGGEEVSAAGQRAILRAICGVLEQVKHVVGVGGGEEKGDKEEEKGEKEGVDGKEGGEAGGKDGDEGKEITDKESKGGKEEIRQVAAAEAGKEEGGTAVSLRIQQVLLKDIIPQLSKHLVAGEAGREEVNSHVALAVTRTLLLLPPDAIRSHLPVLLQTVVNPLKSRSQGTRDAARAALCQVAGALGPAYLGYVIGVLRSALTRGFERHVLGFTLHALLLHAATTHGRTMPPGALDYCLGECLAVAVEGLLGQVAEEREVDAVAAGVREKRQSRSLETVRIAASLVNVRRSTALLLAPIRAALPASLDPRVKRHVQEMVRHMAIGLLANQHATAGDLLVLVHAVLWEGVRVEQAHAAAAGERKRLRAEAREGKGGGEGKEEEGGMEEELGEECGMEGEEVEGKVGGRRRRKKQKGLGFEGMPNGHVVALLGLQLLLSLASHDRLPASDPALTPRLNALVHPLSLALSSPHDAVLAASFRALAFLLHRRLPSVATVAPRVATSAFKVVQQAGRAAAVAGGMVHSCLKLLAVLLDRCPRVKVGEEQVRALLGSAVFTDLELPSTRTTAFAVLRALLRRRVVVPEVYDAMGRVQLLLLRSHTPSVRQLSAALLLAFLLDYPLGPARLEAHLSFLIVNLKYEHQSGREAVLGMLRAIIEGFPSVLVEAHADTFFLPLVTRLVSDESARVRQLVAAVLKALFVRVKPPTCARLLRFASAWLVDPSPQLQQAAALVLGVAVEAVGVGGEQGGMVAAWMGAAARIVQRAQGGEEGEGGGVEGWKGVYACVVLAEKVLQREGGQAHSSSMRALWRQLPALLLHRHLWVRAAACRLLGAYLSHATTAAAAAAGGGGSKGVCGAEEEGLKAVVRELVEKGEQDEGEDEEQEEGEGRGAGVAVWQVLLQPSYLVVVAGALCRVLESNASDERLAQHTVKNLVALAPLLPLLPCRAVNGTAGGGMRKGREGGSGLVVELDGCAIGREGRGRLKLGWQLLRVRRREGEKTGDGSGGEEEDEEEEEEEVLGEAEGGVEGGVEEEEKAEEEEEEEKGDEESYLVDFGEGSGVGDAGAAADAAVANADPGADADADADMEATGAGGGAVMLGEPVGEGSEGDAEGSGEAGDGEEAEERQQSDGEEGGAGEQEDGEGQLDGGYVALREGAGEEATRHIALGAVMKAVARVAYRVKPIQVRPFVCCATHTLHIPSLCASMISASTLPSLPPHPSPFPLSLPLPTHPPPTLAPMHGAHQTAAALRCVAALATALGGEGVRPYLPDVMLPLFRLSQGSAGAVVPPAEVQGVVGEVVEHVRHEVGPAAFIAAFSAARDTARRRAAARREAARVSVLVDPERHARRRASLARKRGEYKKRKNQQHRCSKMR
ncbi:unnamed protein product [Closterium sp. Naga37s-1]|nr:unnamed protein product [Closterium sp. Naga37s-1]